MNGSVPHETAADCAEELSAAQLEQPVVTLRTPARPRPRGRDGHISPGYHMNKKHRVTLESGELLTDSYRLVVAHPPKGERPVGRHTHGTGTRAAR